MVRDPVTIGVQRTSFIVHGNPFRGLGTLVIYVKYSVLIGVEWATSLFKVCIEGASDITGAICANAKCENRGRIDVHNFTAILELRLKHFYGGICPTMIIGPPIVGVSANKYVLIFGLVYQVCVFVGIEFRIENFFG